MHRFNVTYEQAVRNVTSSFWKGNNKTPFYREIYAVSLRYGMHHEIVFKTAVRFIGVIDPSFVVQFQPSKYPKKLKVEWLKLHQLVRRKRSEPTAKQRLIEAVTQKEKLASN